jgi:hypothetical protein
MISPVRILYAAVGATLPADTVAAGGAWPAGWTELGWQEEPFKLTYEFDVKDLGIQQSLAPVARQRINEKLTGEGKLAEFDMAQLALAWGGTLSQTAAGTGQPAKDEVAFGDTPALTARAWGFEGNYVSAAGNVHPIRVFVWRATATAGGEAIFGKEDALGVTLKIAALADMSKSAGQRLFKYQKITGPAT